MNEQLTKVDTSDSIKVMVEKINSIIDFVKQNNYNSVEILNSTITKQLPKKLYVFANSSELSEFTDFEVGDICEIYTSDDVEGKVALYHIVNTSDLKSTDKYISTKTSEVSALYITTYCTESGGKISQSSVGYDNLTSELQEKLDNKLDTYSSSTNIYPVLMKQIRSSEHDKPISDNHSTVEIGGSTIVGHDCEHKCLKMTQEDNINAISEVRLNFSKPIIADENRTVTITTEIAYGKESGHHMMYLIGSEDVSETIDISNAADYDDIQCISLNAYGTSEQVIMMNSEQKLSGNSVPSGVKTANNGLDAGFTEIMTTISPYHGVIDTTVGDTFYSVNCDSEKSILYLSFKSNYIYHERSCYVKGVKIEVTDEVTQEIIETYVWDFADPEALQYSNTPLYDVPYTSANSFRFSNNSSSHTYGECALMKFNLSELAMYVTGDIVLKLVTEQCKNCDSPIWLIPFNTNDWNAASSFDTLQQDIIDSIASNKQIGFTPNIPSRFSKNRISDAEVINGGTEFSEWVNYINITDWVNAAIANGDNYLSLLLVASSQTPNQVKFFSSTVTYNQYGNRNHWVDKLGIPLSMSTLKSKMMVSEFLGLNKQVTEHINKPELDHPDGSVTLNKLNDEVANAFTGLSTTPVLISESGDSMFGTSLTVFRYIYNVFFFTRNTYGDVDGNNTTPSDYLKQVTSGDYSGWYYLDLKPIYSHYSAMTSVRIDFFAFQSNSMSDWLTTDNSIEVRVVGNRVYFSSMPKVIYGTITFGTNNKINDNKLVPISEYYISEK